MLCRFLDAVYNHSFASALPQCAHHSMPAFMQWVVEMQEAVELTLGLNGTAAAGHQPGSRVGRLLLLLVALLATGAAAAAAALYQRRRRSLSMGGRARLQRPQCGGGSTGDEEIELLGMGPSWHDGSGMRHRRPLVPAELVPGRARLKAKAQQQLGSTALLPGRPEAQLLSLLRGMEHALSPSAQKGDPPATAVRASIMPHAGAECSRSNSVALKVQLAQGWGLPTDSLRVQPADLQVGAD